MLNVNVKSSRKILLAKARSKYISTNLARQLVRLESPLKKQYLSTFACCHSLEVTPDKELRSMFYCKNRWCMNCQRIKMANIINKYNPQLDELKKLDDLYFVTLTAPTVEADQLQDRVKEFQTFWRKITNQARRDRQGFRGIRKAECTAKPRGNGVWHYHYHFHVIVSSKEHGEWLLKKWLQLSISSYEDAQNCKPVDELQGGTLELFKYFTKLTNKDKAGNPVEVPAERLDVIFRTLKGKRVFQPFGGLRAVDEDNIEVTPQEVIATPDIYEWFGQDWYSTSYGHSLSGYEPDLIDGRLWTKKRGRDLTLAGPSGDKARHRPPNRPPALEL